MDRIAVIVNRDKPEVAEALEKLRVWAESRRVGLETTVSDPSLAEPLMDFENHAGAVEALRSRFEGCGVAVTLGGDGTLLYGAHLVAPLGIPVLAVNLGSLGFHTQVEPENMLDRLESIMRHEYRTEPRLLLQAELTQGGSQAGKRTTVFALNDIVISRGPWGRMVHLRLHVNGHALTDLYADGLVISTPTGSSAYNFAARGPVLVPALEAIVINAICPHRMLFSPLVVEASALMRIEFHPRTSKEEAHLFVDGRGWESVSHEDSLKISRAPVYLPLIVFEQDFFDKLRDKLAWGGLS